MQFTSPRRALGVLAAATVGLSTALLGAGVAQAAPGVGAPTIEAIEGIDGGLNVYVSAGEGDDPVGWEYSLDGGAHSTLADPALVHESAYDTVVVIDGLDNGDEYEVVVRGVDDQDVLGPWSAPEKGTPFAAPGEPGAPAVQLGNGTATVTWTAPTVAGTYALDGYLLRAHGTGWQTNTPVEETCRTATLSCTVPVLPGYAYNFFVSAVDAEGNVGPSVLGTATAGRIPTLQAPAQVPAKNGDLGISGAQAGAVKPGATVTLTGDGYAPGSSVSVFVYSTPVPLHAADVGADGRFSIQVVIPSSLSLGNHTLVAVGVDANGAPRYVTLPITVSDGGAVLAQATLAATGADVAIPVVGGIVALGLGAGFIVVARRRAAA